MEDLTHLVGLIESDIRAKMLSDGIENVLDSLDAVGLYRGITTSSLTLTLADAISTELMRHVSCAFQPSAGVPFFLTESTYPPATV